MLGNLLAVVPYEKTTPVFSSGIWDADAVWDAQRRCALVLALKENKELERQARVIVADILKNCEESR